MAPLSTDEKVFERLKKLKRIVKKMAFSNYDFVILDGAPGFGEEVKTVIKASDKILVVTTPHRTSVEDAKKLVNLCKKLKKKEVYVVVNRVRNKRFELDFWEIRREVDVPICVVIPEDDEVQKALKEGIPVISYNKNSLASIAFRKLGSLLLSSYYQLSLKEKLKLMIHGYLKFFE